jgi:hypothetical protein
MTGLSRRGLPIARLEQLLDEADKHATNQRYTSLIKHALAGMDDYRPEVCNEALSMTMAILTPADVVRHVFLPLLHEVAERRHRARSAWGRSIC